ncbi:MAG TPA: asparagine synthase C-terminal domain-containing protein, partial [Armatimonadota bacterium]|nr:asparagine synthase C-terminal domain-containing protein [Armatimonadota bacterium]
SGGVDSSLVAALAVKSIGGVRTYSVATEDPALDESGFAAAVARQYDTEHHTLHVRGNARAHLEPLIASMGEPLADASALNLRAISAVAREEVTVVLTGDGGDEGFGGYSRFWAYRQADRLRRLLPAPARPTLAGLALALKSQRGAVRRAGTLLRLAAAPLEQTFGETAWMTDSTRRSLYTPEFRAARADHHPADHLRSAVLGSRDGALVDRAMQAHLLTILPGDYLPKVDCATMSASLEARSPFLDVDVLELGMRIPPDARLRGEPKAMLRRLARKYLPRETVDRKKQGFIAPVGRWLRHEWRDLVDEFVLGPQVEQRGWFQRGALKRLVDEQRAGADWDYLLWTLLVLEMWLRSANGSEHDLQPAGTAVLSGAGAGR